MIEPKSAINTILNTIPSVLVYQSRPEVIEIVGDTVTLTFSIGGNVPEYVLEKEIAYQNVEINVDIWARTSKLSGQKLTQLEEVMLDNNYRMVGCLDVPEADGYSHISCRFRNTV